MFEKVNPCHPDKVADRIAGAIVDLAYVKSENPKVAAEVLIGHGRAVVMIESSEDFGWTEIGEIVHRLAGNVELDLTPVKQDQHLAENQNGAIRCGDNGIFKGVPPTHEQKLLTDVVADIYKVFPYDGKYTIHVPQGEQFAKITACQSHVFTDLDTEDLVVAAWGNNRSDDPIFNGIWNINPLGPWTGGINVDCGCTNRKLGSDMGDGVTGGGLMGKDLSKADISVNIVCYLKAVASGQVVTAICSIGDEEVTFTYADGKRETETFADVVEMARLYILTDCNGSFERFAEWGLVRPLAQVKS